MPFATSGFLLLVRPGATSFVLAPGCGALVASGLFCYFCVLALALLQARGSGQSATVAMVL